MPTNQRARLLAWSIPLAFASVLGAQGPTLADAQAAARTIDAMVGRALAARQQEPNPLVDDATFLRRAYLTIVGRIPSAAEAQAFLRDGSGNRRAALIERLLESPGRDSHEFHYWADLLRGRSRLMRQTSGEPFLHWLKESIAADQPYDAMVRDMLTAEGPAHQRGNGATGYILRDLGMPLDNMANTIRVFLGTRVECAQCHNHPFDKWTQRQFFEMSAFFGGMRYQSDFERSAAGQSLRQMAQQVYAEHGRQAQQALRRLILPLGVGVAGSGTGLLRLPDDYKYDDAKPGQPVAAQVIFGERVDLPVELPRVPQRPPARAQAARGRNVPVGKEVDARETFAAWLTDPANPRFAANAANRQWKRVFGRGLIEPVDDLRDDTRAAIPELMDFLAQLFADLRFDVKQYQRVLLHTQLFQRAVPADEPAAEAAYLFPGPLLQRLSAEQLWDSLLTLVVRDVDSRLLPPGARAEEVYRRFDDLANASPELLRDLVGRELVRYSDPAKYRELERERRAQEVRARMAQNDERQREARPILRDLALARRKGDEAETARLMARLRDLGVAIPGERLPGGGDRDLLRASDLQQPAPANHLLRLFGQSDRETAEAASREATVPQVLAMLNGFVEQQVLGRKDSALRQQLDAARTPPEKVRVAYLAILGREPDARERVSWTPLVQAGEAGVRDLVWVLVNSHEFRFQR